MWGIFGLTKGTIDYGLKYEVNQKINLEGHVDSHWIGSAIDRKITSGRCIRGNLGSKMGLIRKHTNNKFCELEFNNQ